MPSTRPCTTATSTPNNWTAPSPPSTSNWPRAKRQVAELRARQSEDQRRQEANAALALTTANAYEEWQRWARLESLIGSASGDKFRKLAQAYNLDLLVHHANVQLRQLVRRYRLKRGGSMLGLLVMDTEMGDELRSVHSLSGGETFLVSLALALGLASMASSTLKIESLFIDEGFGSLDPESLQLAMDALDGLQAQGRKVAVISHVQEMHERIPGADPGHAPGQWFEHAGGQVSEVLLYSFRRCPYAMRARLALRYSGVSMRIVEVSLKAKPAEMLALSPKGTVPVLVVDGVVIDESLAIMQWALAQHDPDDWLLTGQPGHAGTDRRE